MTNEMVVVKVFNNETEAEIAKGHLESEGITALITKGDVGGMYPSLQQTEGVKLLVNKNDAEEARGILEDRT